MSFGYTSAGYNQHGKKWLAVLGTAAIPLLFHFQSQGASPLPDPGMPVVTRDPRVTRLKKFFQKLDCPIAPLAEDFIKAADVNSLDWRLLPSIAVIESSGGKAYKNNNIFGWNRGEESFATIRSGLELVAYKLGHSPLYSKHNSLGKLRVYNEHEDYAPAVLAVMNRICPQVKLRPVVTTAAVDHNLETAELIRY